ncbi:TetR/AcrR family transcriptional regulator [Nonomuraea antimicrobica]
MARDGHRAKLEEITEQAGLTTGAVYSLFGSKNGLLIALVTDYLGPHYDGIKQVVSPVSIWSRLWRSSPATITACAMTPKHCATCRSRSACRTWPCATPSYGPSSPPPSGRTRNV